MRQIPEEQILTRMRSENSWWISGAIPNPFDDWTPRRFLHGFQSLVEDRDVRRAVVLLGPRRVGKTVMAHHSIGRLLTKGANPRSIFYIALDQPIYNGLSLEDLVRAYERAANWDAGSSQTTVVFDEIQYLKDWEAHLKALVDSWPNIKFVATGSAAAALKIKSRESGAGRFTDFMLPPLTFFEFIEIRGELGLFEPCDPNGPEPKGWRSPQLELANHQFLDYLNFGGYPEAVLSPAIQSDPARFIRADIIDKVLLRDLPSLYGIQDVQELNSLFTTLAYNTAGEVSLEALSKGSGVSKPTIKRYIEYLEAAFLVRIVHRVDRDGTRFKRSRTFKVYLSNPSMRCALFSPVGDNDPAVGHLVETAVFTQWMDHESHRLYYARWPRGEVDLTHVWPPGRVNWVQEIKWSDRVVESKSELSGLLAFCKEHDLAKALVTTKTRREERSLDGVAVRFRPAAEHCFTLSYNLLAHESRDPASPAG